MGQSNQLTLDLMKSVLKDKGGELTNKDYARFWQGLTKPDAATTFIREMITECIEIERQIAKKKMDRKGADIEVCSKILSKALWHCVICTDENKHDREYNEFCRKFL